MNNKTDCLDTREHFTVEILKKQNIFFSYSKCQAIHIMYKHYWFFTLGEYSLQSIIHIT